MLLRTKTLSLKVSTTMARKKTPERKKQTDRLGAKAIGINGVKTEGNITEKKRSSSKGKLDCAMSLAIYRESAKRCKKRTSLEEYG